MLEVERGSQEDIMELKKLPYELTVCKVSSPSDVDLDAGFFCLAVTDDEVSLVCRTEDAPSETIAREDGWRGFVISGELDFSLVGVLSGVSGILADAGVPIFAISTYNTDYVLVKAADLTRAETALAAAGYAIA